MLANERLAAAAKEGAQNERDDDDIVDLACDGDEVRYQVKRKCEITSERDQESLLPPWDARVAK